MIHLDLNVEEKEALIGVLESYLSDLRYEIAYTDSMDFRNELKQKKELLKKLLQALQQSVDQARERSD